MPTAPLYHHAHILLRVGIASALLYPPFAALSDPIAWSGYFPAFVHAIPIDIELLLHAFGALEVVLALWILSGWRIRVPSALTAALLIAIVGFNTNDFGVLFRDIPIACTALALSALPAPAHESA